MGKHDDDDVEEINLQDGQTADDLDEGSEDEDRGDVVNPEETEENLKKLADEDEDEDETDDEGEAEPDGKSPKMIPKSRFDEVNERRIRAEERLKMLDEQRATAAKGAEEEAPAAVDLKDLRKQQRAALMEGDEDKAAELDEQIDAEVERRATLRAVANLSESQAKAELKAAAAAVIEDYPFLDSTSRAANKEAIAEVVAFRDSYISRGMGHAEALMKAAEKVGKFYAPAKSKKVADEDDEDDDPKSAKTKIDELRERRLRKNAKTANQQPARLEGGVGNRGTGGKLNIEDMDDDQFSRLSEKDKAKARGDLV